VELLIVPKSNQEKALIALLSPSQPLEDAAQGALHGMDVNNARGVHLDRVGAKVGEERAGESNDEVYRRYVRSKVSTNRSNSNIPDIIRVARTIVPETPPGGIVNDNVGHGAFILRIEGVAVDAGAARVLVRNVLKSAGAGVRAIVGYTAGAPSSRARWSTQGTWGSGRWSRVRSKEI
jgi:hypothetical protein